jgi:DNA-binding XRE family transcriptional regulator
MKFMSNRKATTWGQHEREMRNKGILTSEREAEIQAETNILNALTQARNEHKISQRKLEELTGVRKVTINRIENGYNSPTVDTLIKVLAPLGKTLAVVPLERN